MNASSQMLNIENLEMIPKIRTKELIIRIIQKHLLTTVVLIKLVSVFFSIWSYMAKVNIYL